MKREKKKPLWRKLPFTESPSGMNKVHIPAIRTSVIKPNERIRATVEELGKHIGEFILVDPGDYDVDLPTEEKEAKGPVRRETSPQGAEEYHVKHTGGGWYNVESSAGKVMNEEKLKKAEAEELVAELEEETKIEE